MKAYCMNCGHPTEYLAAPPQKCETCGLLFAKAKVEFTLRINPDQKPRPIKEVIQEQLEGSEFESFMEGAPEPFSEEEISNIFLKDAVRSINLRDMMAEGVAKQEQTKGKKAKPRGRKRK